MTKQFNMTIDLSPQEIKEAIAFYVNQNLADGMCADEKDVTINVGIEYEDRPCGTDYPALKGAAVKVKKMGSYQDR